MTPFSMPLQDWLYTHIYVLSNHNLPLGVVFLFGIWTIWLQINDKWFHIPSKSSKPYAALGVYQEGSGVPLQLGQSSLNLLSSVSNGKNHQWGCGSSLIWTKLPSETRVLLVGIEGLIWDAEGNWIKRVFKRNWCDNSIMEILLGTTRWFSQGHGNGNWKLIVEMYAKLICF